MTAHRFTGPGAPFRLTTSVPGDKSLSHRALILSGMATGESRVTGTGTGRLCVAMTNLIFAAPSNGAVKYPGTIQVFDVQTTAATPVASRPTPGLATETIRPGGYNPSALTVFEPDRAFWEPRRPR